jgi:hypothetical protein
MNNIPAITELKELAPIGFWGVVVIILIVGCVLLCGMQKTKRVYKK